MSDDDDFDCRLCESDTPHLFSCRDCSRLFCAEHIDPDEHFCGNSAFGITLSNGSSYYFSVAGWQRGFIERCEGRGYLGTLFSVVFASPVTFTLLVFMWVWFFFVQFQTLVLMGPEQFEAWTRLFGLTAESIHQPWMWLVAMFSHGNLIHLLVNSIVLAMFGPFVENRLGTWSFAVVFVLTGMATVVAQVGAATLGGAELLPVLGASGAIAGVIGVYMTMEPDVRVFLFFIIPLPMWIAATAVLVGSFMIPVFWGIGAFGLAHIAHGTGVLLGLVVGLAADTDALLSHLTAVTTRWRDVGRTVKQSACR